MTDLGFLERLPRSGGAARIGEDSGAWELRSRATVERQIAEVLREKIIGGVIARGQKLKQAEIARLLGVSITPVREALRLLEAQGYVAVKAHRGAVVAPFMVEGAEELYELRQVLESRLTREAAQRMTSSDLNALKALNHDFWLRSKRTRALPCRKGIFVSTSGSMSWRRNPKPSISSECCGPNTL